ncbi:hypothetical protein Pd630_LPD16190 (plasmid) [Rhodococcus opacus PD630]|nr:hypothetical protein Pd630_LPD16190 [Rhodococcus opacus PD630]
MLAALAVLASATYLLVPRLTQRHITAYFPAATGLYEGDEVRILGVAVGTIERVDPEGTHVAVQMTVDRTWKLPAHAQAVMMSPTLVTARFVQLTPTYQDGDEELPDDAVIPQDRTAVPVEWDKIKEQLTRLSSELGPDEPKAPTDDVHGALGEFVSTAADNLRGNGSQLNQTLHQLSDAMTTLSDGRADLFTIVRDLRTLVDVLAGSHEQIVAFENHLASVTQLFAESSTSLGQAVSDLDTAVGDIQQFVHDNHDGLTRAVDGLGAATQVLVDQRQDVEQVLHVAPHGLVDVYNIYQPAQNSLTGAPALTNFANPIQFICSAIAAAGEENAQQATGLCTQYLGPLLNMLKFNYLPAGAVVGNSIGATLDQIDYSEPGLARSAPTTTSGDTQLRIASPTGSPAPAGLQGLLLPPPPAPQGGTR